MYRSSKTLVSWGRDLIKTHLAFLKESPCLFTSSLLSQHTSSTTEPPKFIETTASKKSLTSKYVDETYRAWQQDPKSVHQSWDVYFRANTAEANSKQVQMPIDTFNLYQLISLLQQKNATETWPPTLLHNASAMKTSLSPMSAEDKLVEDQLKLYMLIRAYQYIGHKSANLDPLGIGRYLYLLLQFLSTSAFF